MVLKKYLVLKMLHYWRILSVVIATQIILIIYVWNMKSTKVSIGVIGGFMIYQIVIYFASIAYAGYYKMLMPTLELLPVTKKQQEDLFCYGVEFMVIGTVMLENVILLCNGKIFGLILLINAFNYMLIFYTSDFMSNNNDDGLLFVFNIILIVFDVLGIILINNWKNVYYIPVLFIIICQIIAILILRNRQKKYCH